LNLSVRHERQLLWTLAAIQFTMIADFMVLSPLGPVLMRTFLVGPSELGYLVSAYSLSAAAAGLLAALFIDRFDRRRVLLVAFGVFMLALLACAVAPSYRTLIIARLISGASGGVLGAMVYTILGDVIPAERRGAAAGVIATAFSVSSVMGLPIGLFFASHFGWHAPFYFLLALGAVICICIWRVVPSLTEHLQARAPRNEPGAGSVSIHPFAAIAAVLREANHRRAYLFALLVWSSSFVVIPFVSIYNVVNVGITEKELPLIYFVGGIATLFSSRLVGKLTDRVGARRAYQWIALLAIPVFILTTNLPAMPLWLVLICMTLFFVVIPARTIPTMAIMTQAAQPALRGTFMSLHGSIQSLTTSLAAFVGGLIITRNAAGQLQHYDVLGYIAVALTLMAAGWVRRVKAAPLALEPQAPTNKLNTPV
jgi:predicted MFS family arabinose efflux permease